jgi:general secretion pathway protein B
MSLILDALRKMEEDRKSRRSEALDIRPEVLKYRAAPKPQQAKPYKLPVVAAVLLAVGIGAGIFLRGSGSTKLSQHEASNTPATEAQTPAMPQTAPAAPVAPAAPAAPVSAATPPIVMERPAAPAAPAMQPAPTVAPPAAPIAQPVSQPVAAVSDVKKGRKRTASAMARQEAAGVSQPVSPRREYSSEPLPSLPEVTITGIAWQDERSLRRAVLNGSLVGEGAEVAGARVVEIRENKVRLSRGGQLFEVIMSGQR